MQNYVHKGQPRGVVMTERRGYTAAVVNPVATRLSQEVAGWREMLERLVGPPSPLRYSNCNPWGRCINRFGADTWPELNWLFGWLCTGKQGTSTFYSGSNLLICFPSMLLTVLYQDQALGCRVQSTIGTLAYLIGQNQEIAEMTGCPPEVAKPECGVTVSCDRALSGGAAADVSTAGDV